MGVPRATAAIAISILLAGLVAYYLFSPLIFLRSLSNAAKNADRDALAAEVDFPSIRAGLDGQLDRFLDLRAQARTSHGHTGTAGIVEAFLPAVGHRLINAIVTPDGVAIILRQHVKQAADSSGRPALWRGHLSWMDLNHVEVKYANTPRPDRPFSLVLERREIFSWRLVRLNLPLRELVGASQ